MGLGSETFLTVLFRAVWDLVVLTGFALSILCKVGDGLPFTQSGQPLLFHFVIGIEACADFCVLGKLPGVFFGNEVEKPLSII